MPSYPLIRAPLSLPPPPALLRSESKKQLNKYREAAAAMGFAAIPLMAGPAALAEEAAPLNLKVSLRTCTRLTPHLLIAHTRLALHFILNQRFPFMD